MNEKPWGQISPSQENKLVGQQRLTKIIDRIKKIGKEKKQRANIQESNAKEIKKKVTQVLTKVKNDEQIYTEKVITTQINGEKLSCALRYREVVNHTDRDEVIEDITAHIGGDITKYPLYLRLSLTPDYMINDGSVNMIPEIEPYELGYRVLVVTGKMRIGNEDLVIVRGKVETNDAVAPFRTQVQAWNYRDTHQVEEPIPISARGMGIAGALMDTSEEVIRNLATRYPNIFNTDKVAIIISDESKDGWTRRWIKKSGEYTTSSNEKEWIKVISLPPR